MRGASPSGGLAVSSKRLFLLPWTVITYMFSGAKVEYLLGLFGPMLFLPLLSARTLIAAPILYFNLVSTFYYQTNLHYHYTSLVIPVLIVTTILVLGRFEKARVQRAAVLMVVLATFVTGGLCGPLPGSLITLMSPIPMTLRRWLQPRRWRSFHQMRSWPHVTSSPRT